MLIMKRYEIFVDSSIFVGGFLGDSKAINLKAINLMEIAIDNGCLLVTNTIVFSETTFKIMYTLAFRMV